jgi:hypothetical protein
LVPYHDGKSLYGNKPAAKYWGIPF